MDGTTPHLPGVPVLVLDDAAYVEYLAKLLLAEGVLLSAMRRRAQLEYRTGTEDVRPLWLEDLGHSRHDLPPFARPAVDLVRRGVVCDIAKERGLGQGPARLSAFNGPLDGLGRRPADHDVLVFGSYETAWAWLHKLRRAMARPERELLDRVVGLDQSFMGGRSAGKQGAVSDEVPITIAVERIHGRLGRVRLELADKSGGLDMIDFACEVIAPVATIHTDGARVFARLIDRGYTHQGKPGSTADDLDAVMPGTHLVSSLLKRWTAGTLHSGSDVSRRAWPSCPDPGCFSCTTDC